MGFCLLAYVVLVHLSIVLDRPPLAGAAVGARGDLVAVHQFPEHLVHRPGVPVRVSLPSLALSPPRASGLRDLHPPDRQSQGAGSRAMTRSRSNRANIVNGTPTLPVIAG